METGDLALVEGVLGEFLREADEDGLALLDATVAELADCEHEAGEGSEVVALFGGEPEETDAFVFVGSGAGHAEDPADGRGFEAKHVVLDADGEVGVVERGVEGEGLLGVLAGELAEFIGAVFVAVDEGGPIGLHAGGDGLAVKGVGVFGIALECGVGQVLGLSDAVVEALLEGWVDGRALTGFEAVVVCEELDVEDAEAIEFGEDVGSGVRGRAEGIFGMVGDPLLKVGVGSGEVEVVEGVVAVVERSAGEGGDATSAGGQHEKESEKGREQQMRVTGIVAETE
jgi:hypothetical protein